MSSYVTMNLRMATSKPDKTMEDVILNLGWEYYSASKAVEYSRKVLKARWLKAEPKIKKVPYQAYLYARHVIGGRWKEAEKSISNNALASYLYSKYVLKERFKLSENKKIWKEDPRSIYLYSKYVLKGRWKNKEKCLSDCVSTDRVYYRGLEDVVNYAVKIKKQRWKEIEPAITQSRYIQDYYEFLTKKEDQEEFYNMVLAQSLTDNGPYYINYAREFIKSNKKAG